MTKNGRSPDPRPARTREAFFIALRELMLEKRWEKIRVQDILERSGHGRSTFYAHFNSKFDLLTAAIPEVVLPIASSDERVPRLLHLFEHIEEMHPVLYPLMNQTVLGEIIDTFQRQLSQSWFAHLGPLCPSDDDAAFVSELLAAGLLATGKKWILAGCDRPTEDVCADFERYASALIEEATVPTS